MEEKIKKPDWNKTYMPFKLWKTLYFEVRYKGDIEKYNTEKEAIDEAISVMDPHDIFGKALIFERKQSPYYSDETEAMLIGSVNYLGELTYA